MNAKSFSLRRVANVACRVPLRAFQLVGYLVTGSRSPIQRGFDAGGVAAYAWISDVGASSVTNGVIMFAGLTAAYGLSKRTWLKGIRNGLDAKYGYPHTPQGSGQDLN